MGSETTWKQSTRGATPRVSLPRPIFQKQFNHSSNSIDPFSQLLTYFKLIIQTNLADMLTTTISYGNSQTRTFVRNIIMPSTCVAADHERKAKRILRSPTTNQNSFQRQRKKVVSPHNYIISKMMYSSKLVWALSLMVLATSSFAFTTPKTYRSISGFDVATSSSSWTSLTPSPQILHKKKMTKLIQMSEASADSGASGKKGFLEKVCRWICKILQYLSRSGQIFCYEGTILSEE